MARKANNNPLDNTALEAPPPAVLADHEQSAQLLTVQRGDEARVRAVALQLGYQLPADCVDPDLIQRDISINMRRSVEACLEVGRGLGVLKAACEHGMFLSRLDVLGIDCKVAARFMQSAVKFSNVATSRHLTNAIGNQSKLFEMLVLDDESLEELALTGQTGELKLDDVATMSVKELRNAIRVSRELLTQKTQRIERMATENDALAEKLARVKTAKPDAVLKEIKQAFSGFALDLEFSIANQLQPAVRALAEHSKEHGSDVAGLINSEIGRLETTLRELRQEFFGATEADVAEWAR